MAKLGILEQTAQMSTDSSTSPATSKISLLSRLHAWWEGDEVEADGDQTTADGEATAGDGGSGAEAVGWPAPRLAAAQRLFGEGCTIPGSEQAVVQLIEPLELDQDKSVVDVTAGIGTAARIIAEKFGCKVDGLENDPALVEQGTKFAEKAGLGEKVTMREGSLGHCDLEPGSRDAIFGIGALLDQKDKTATFLDMWTLLKPGGQVLLAEYVAKKPAEAKEDAAKWATIEKRRPHLSTLDQIKQGLAAGHMDVHLTTDISEEFCGHITHGLAGLADVLKQGSIPKDQGPWIMWEVELWAHKVSMLESGNIGFYLFHASKAEE